MHVLLLAMLLIPSLAFATDYTVPLTGTTANEDAALSRMYLDACNDRVRAEPPLSALAGCTSTGSPATCTCNPTKVQLETALGSFLKGQLTNKYQNMLDAEGKIVGQKYPQLTPDQQSAIRAQCPTCVF